MDTHVNADFSRPALVHAAALPWQASPMPGVERRSLERLGGEVALATSLVRYAPGSQFTPHRHDLGEEFIVLEGVFSDEHGHFPAGSYVRNPPGTQHRPFSTGGCIIFVKLRHMHPSDRRAARVLPGDREWQPVAAGVEHCELPGASWLRLAPGSDIVLDGPLAAHELFVFEGGVGVDGAAVLPTWAWLRQPQAAVLRLASPGGALLWLRHSSPMAAEGANHAARA